VLEEPKENLDCPPKTIDQGDDLGGNGCITGIRAVSVMGYLLSGRADGSAC
jgi:hypothetical protein